MAFVFEEIDYQQTPLGAISLRRRSEPRLNDLILFEVKLNDEFLMSSLFTEAEIQLSKLGLGSLLTGPLANEPWEVIVGGLGLGYTAVAALEFEQLASLQVVDVMAAVISWHQQELVPMGKTLNDDARCDLVLQDFFEVATNPQLTFDGQHQADYAQQVHAILLDIDHSPSYWLNPGNGDFYTQASLQSMRNKLKVGGVFALWSDEPPADDFIALLNQVFGESSAHVVPFENPYTGGVSTNSVYIAHRLD